MLPNLWPLPLADSPLLPAQHWHLPGWPPCSQSTGSYQHPRRRHPEMNGNTIILTGRIMPNKDFIGWFVFSILAYSHRL